MKPVVFTIPFLNWDIPGYGLMLMLGFLISIWWATRRAEKSGADPEVILNVGFLALVGGVVGCRIMYVVHYWEQFASRGSAWDIFLAVVDIRKGGLEFYGGFILTILMTLLWLRFKERVSIRWYLDIMAPSAALGLAIGRIGCFLNGCCFGGVCDLPWAVQFPYGSPPAVHQWQAGVPGAALPEQLLFTHTPGLTMPISRESMAASPADLATVEKQEKALGTQLAGLQTKLAQATSEGRPSIERQIKQVEQKRNMARGAYLDLRRNMERYGLTHEEIHTLAAAHGSPRLHPTQLYSTVTAGLIALLLNAFYYRRTRDGQVILLLLAIEPVTRWMLEVIRTDNPIDTLGVFTISQGLAVTMTVLGIVGLFALQFLPPRSPRAVLFEPEDETNHAAPVEPAG